MRARAGLAILAALVLFAGAWQLTRAGYSPDEEFTVFAVQGITADGLPLLPSGLLYDRGLAYSYSSWLAGTASRSGLPAYRALSLLSGIAALAIIFALVRRLSSTTAALIASLLVATSLPFWAAATTGRFYAPFFALYLGALLALSTVGTLGTLGTNPLGTLRLGSVSGPRSGQARGTVRTVRTVVGALVVLSVFARWTHELAFTLLAVPALAFVLAPKSERRDWWRALMAIGLGLASAQVVLFALHYLAPSSGETMVRRFFVWQVLNLFEAPPDRQYGMVLVVMVIAWLLAPRRAWLTSVVALSGASMVLAYAIARASNDAPLSRELVVAVAAEGARYPLDMFWHIARANPVTLVVAVALMVARLAGAGRFDSRSSLRAGEWHAAERALHLLWIGWVLWFGVIESGITINYLLLPVSFMLVAIAVDVVAIARHLGLDLSRPVSKRGLSPTLAAAVVIVAIVGDQWRGDGSIAARLAAARPTIDAPGLSEIRDSLQPTDRVACTDELGCLMLLGRVDRWLALDDYVRERFLVKQGDENFVGVYAGAPAAFRPAELFSPGPDGTVPERTLIVDIFKEYPVGNSRSWLPRAINADGLEVRPLLETPQLRVLQVSPPVGHAARQHLGRPGGLKRRTSTGSASTSCSITRLTRLRWAPLKSHSF